MNWRIQDKQGYILVGFSDDVVRMLRMNLSDFRRTLPTVWLKTMKLTSPDQWRHCPGKVNPANDASRGLKQENLSRQHRWWRGPEFI